MDIDNRINTTGSITIEASLVFPFILLILIITIYIIIYIHDMSCLQSIANGAMLEIQKYHEDTNYTDRIEKGIYTDGHSEETIIKQVINFINQTAAERLLIKDIDNLKIDIKMQNYLVYKKIEIYISREIGIPYISKGCLTPMKVVSKTKYLQPTHCIRGLDFVDDITSEIEVIKPIKNKYDSILEEIEITIHEWI